MAKRSGKDINLAELILGLFAGGQEKVLHAGGILAAMEKAGVIIEWTHYDGHPCSETFSPEWDRAMNELVKAGKISQRMSPMGTGFVLCTDGVPFGLPPRNKTQ